MSHQRLLYYIGVAHRTVSKLWKKSSEYAVRVMTENRETLSPPRGSISVRFGGTPPPLPESITVVSLNLCGLSPSSAAPIGWAPIPAFRSEILRHSPDVVCLQELPGQQENGFLPGYECVGTRPSHCKNVALFFKAEWAHRCVRTKCVQSPAVLATVDFSLKNNSCKKISFASCHLAPFKENARARLEQVKQLLLSSTTDNLLVAGDFNMRTFEDSSVEELGLEDAWKSAGSVYSEKFTWDSCDNTPKGGPYNRYREGAYPFHCRFDRVYVRGFASVADFRLIANRPLTNPYHYLSDHYGMVATVKINA